jgi:hypothetical protein
MSDVFKDALHKAQAELAALEERRETLRKLIENLAKLSDDDRFELEPPPGYEPEGLTQEIRVILGLTATPMTPPEIRDALINRGYKKESSSKNLLISVHTVLTRIDDEVEKTTTTDGRTAYRGKLSGRSVYLRSGPPHSADEKD